MNNKDLIQSLFEQFGFSKATEFQDNVSKMTSEEIKSSEVVIPEFDECIKNKNMLDRSVGFVCKTKQGNVVKLIKAYDSTKETKQPEDLTNLWEIIK